MSESNCPFCNAPLPALAAPPAGANQPCPRCGEPVAAARWPIDPALATAIQVGEAPVRPRTDFRPANRKTGLIVLVIMISMAVAGLSYALWTMQIRRARDPKTVGKLEPIAARRPTELAGLAYLPKDCQLIAGLHIAEMLNEKTGQAILAEPRPMMLDWGVKQITRTTGLKLGDLDHIVLAAAFDANFPQLVMIVKTRPKILPEKIAAHSQLPGRSHEEKPLYEFSLEPPLGGALVWCVDEHTLIYLIRLDAPQPAHLHGLSATPRKIDEALPGVLAKTMNERLPTHPYAWAVGRLDHLGLAKDLLPLGCWAARPILGRSRRCRHSLSPLSRWRV